MKIQTTRQEKIDMLNRIEILIERMENERIKCEENGKRIKKGDNDTYKGYLRVRENIINSLKS